MNILVVHEIDYMRDPIFQFHVLAELLSLRGHNVYVADYGATTGSGIVAHCQEIDVARSCPKAKVHLVRSPLLRPLCSSKKGHPAPYLQLQSSLFSRTSYSLMYYSTIRRVIRDKKIDVVLLYSAPTNGLQTIIAAHRLSIPVVFYSLDVLHKLVPKALSLPTKVAEGWVYRHADKILTITPALSRYVVSLGANPDKVGILPLGIDLQRPPEALWHKSEGLWGETGIKYPTMVFAGTLPLFSGLPVLIGQLPEMIARIPNLRLLIVGDGVQRPELERMIRELNLGERVKITGMVPHSDVPKWIAQADIGVLTFPAEGATRDIFPTKVLQYMAQGKPVVANPLLGLTDYGLGEEQGVVYVRDGGWGGAIEYAIRNRDVLGEKARRYVEREHGYDKIIHKLEITLAKIVGV